MSSDIESLRAEVESLKVNVHQLKLAASDHAQRLDTLQTKPWKRFWFWAYHGWPLWTDLNADQPARRPWKR